MLGHGGVGRHVLGVVPHERGHPLVAGDPEIVVQRMSELRGERAELGKGEPARAVAGPRHDLRAAVHGRAVFEQAGDLQREVHHRATHDPNVSGARHRMKVPEWPSYRLVDH